MELLKDKKELRQLEWRSTGSSFLSLSATRRRKWFKVLEWTRFNGVDLNGPMRDYWAKLAWLLGGPPLYKRRYEHVNAVWGLEFLTKSGRKVPVVLCASRQGLSAQICPEDAGQRGMVVDELYKILVKKS